MRLADSRSFGCALGLSFSFLVAGCGDGGLSSTNTQPDLRGGGGPADLAPRADLTPLPDLATPLPDLSVSALPDLAQPQVIEDMTYVAADANGVLCGTQTCAVGLVCCAGRTDGGVATSCQQSCDDAGITVACDGPEDCNGNPCCAQFTVGGMGNNNPIGGIMCTSAMSDCSPGITSFMAPYMGTTRLCHADDDCTRDTTVQGFLALDTCCHVSYQGTTIQACLTKIINGNMGVTCP